MDTTHPGDYTDTQLLHYFHQLTPENRIRYMSKLILAYRAQAHGFDWPID